MDRKKYPSTPFLPWSSSVDPDDHRLVETSHFHGEEVVATEKMDGENTTIYPDGRMHARSIDSRHHPSRDWVKALAGKIGHELPEGWRICGENMYAVHSLEYEDLESYFYLFSVWDAENRCLSWDETEEWAAMLGVPTPEVFYRGPWNAEALKQISVDVEKCEGYVVRTVEGFHYDDFRQHLAKWVRPNHVQTDEHWMHKVVVPNRLKE